MEAAVLGQAKKRAVTFSAAQALIGSAAPIAIGTGAIVGSMLLGADKSLATAPVTGFNIGVALGTLPAAWLMSKVGRRNGFMSGTLATALGGLVAAYAIIIGSFVLFAVGLMFVGVGGAFAQQYRFAAADGAPSHFKPKAISWVLAGGIFAAIIGPQTVIFTRDLSPPFMFAASYASLVIIALLGALALSFVKVPPLVAADRAMGAEKPARPLRDIASQPRFIVGLSCAVGSYALMSFVMTGAPLAMIGAGCTPDEALLGISWHVMAMFAPSFFTGNLIVRFGKERVLGAGLAILGVSALVALHDQTVAHFWVSLILLGLGWNFGFIGSTAIISETYLPSEKNKAEGLHDFILFGSVAVASLMSGIVYESAGWAMLNMIIFPVIVLCGLLLIFSMRRKTMIL